MSKRTEKPEKRLVSTRKYISVMGERLSLRLFAWLQLACGLGGVFLLTFLAAEAYEKYTASGMSELYLEGTIVGFVAIGSLTSLLLISCRSLFRKAKKIEPVTLLTPQTAHLLAPEECLVRASDLPPFQQQTELLRAAPYGSHTPSEALLRASRTDDTGT